MDYWAIVFDILVNLSVLLSLTGLYFLPTLVAYARSHRDLFRIFLLNLALGITVVGWILALRWALKNSGYSHSRDDEKPST